MTQNELKMLIFDLDGEVCEKIIFRNGERVRCKLGTFRAERTCVNDIIFELSEDFHIPYYFVGSMITPLRNKAGFKISLDHATGTVFARREAWAFE